MTMIRSQQESTPARRSGRSRVSNCRNLPSRSPLSCGYLILFGSGFAGLGIGKLRAPAIRNDGACPITNGARRR